MPISGKFEADFSQFVQETLQEQLERAVANEEYEVAARLRDALRKRR